MNILSGISLSLFSLALGTLLSIVTLANEIVFDMKGGWVVVNRIFTGAFLLVGFMGFVLGILIACGVVYAPLK
jgi:hypothetical protein